MSKPCETLPRDPRSIGRVIADLSDKYDKLPENHPFRRELARMIHDLAVELERREREASADP